MLVFETVTPHSQDSQRNILDLGRPKLKNQSLSVQLKKASFPTPLPYGNSAQSDLGVLLSLLGGMEAHAPWPPPEIPSCYFPLWMEALELRVLYTCRKSNSFLVALFYNKIQFMYTSRVAGLNQ